MSTLPYFDSAILNGGARFAHCGIVEAHRAAAMRTIPEFFAHHVNERTDGVLRSIPVLEIHLRHAAVLPDCGSATALPFLLKEIAWQLSPVLWHQLAILRRVPSDFR